MRDNPCVSIIVPCRNEERFIGKCLESILAQDYPKENMEVFLVDGASEDATKKVAQEYAHCHSFIHVLDNVRKTTPCAMNIGIRAAKGDVIMRMDAHSVYGKDYVSKCVASLIEYGADNVGGVLRAIQSDDTLVAKAIALALSHRFGMGNSYTKIGNATVREVDTVAFGCFRREVFERIGLYDEHMTRSQDLELNLRLKKAGGIILFIPDIMGCYYAKSSLGAFLKQNLVDGSWVIYPWKFGKRVFAFRHLVPALFVMSVVLLTGLSLLSSTMARLLIAGIGSYLFVLVFFSVGIAAREREVKLTPLLPVVFLIRHFGYGAGSLWGAGRVLTS